MSIVLTLEQGPRAQPRRQARLDQGELVIGRSAEADWQIEDPDMFVSRAHCRIASRQNDYIVTDTSSSGLFIDDAESPLGTGNSMRLRDGMRLRLGDYVLGVEIAPTALEEQPAPPRPQSEPAGTPSRSAALGEDDFFSMKAEEVVSRPRPKNLPDPFEKQIPGAYRNFENEAGAAPRSPAFDDPFSLDPVATPDTGKEPARGTAAKSVDASRYTFFGTPVDDGGPVPEEQDDAFGFERPARAEKPAPIPEKRIVDTGPAPAPWDLPAEPPAMAPAAPRRQAAAAPSRGGAVSESALRAAFLRGAGLDEADASGLDLVSEMEKFGREYRMMMDGLMQLLRKRAEEKANARIGRTLVGAKEVNPLKFLPSVDDAMAMIFAGGSPGFLAGEQAIADAVRDLADHHIRSWIGIQGALRRMVDRFSPTSLEEELKGSSALGTLLSGGRSAKLWELYCKRHKEIAESAETRFLGDIGADFRDAYEGE